MGKQCTFTDATFTDQSCMTSWSVCLKALSRYAVISSIARRSLHLLQQSAQRLNALCLDHRPQNAQALAINDTQASAHHQMTQDTNDLRTAADANLIPEAYPAQTNVRYTNGAGLNLAHGDKSLSELADGLFGGEVLQFGDLQDFDDGILGSQLGMFNWV